MQNYTTAGLIFYIMDPKRGSVFFFKVYLKKKQQQMTKNKAKFPSMQEFNEKY